ncbi:hypothetical protein [Paenibacillus humicola]|uniref:hypothetical protein n=1 Tax=Paenibacillus humicola TaxID=3110540 RepID=UPI00237BFD23|nr:hypothetical protein [Paenibacillus humicola]
MAKWRESLDARREEWKQVEEALSRTLAGRSVLRVGGPGAPRLAAPASKSVRSGELAGVEGTFEAGLACFCLRELPAAERRDFLNLWHSRLRDGATAVLADRRGEGCETAFQLHELFAPAGTTLDVQVGRTFWWVRYKVKKPIDAARS